MTCNSVVPHSPTAYGQLFAIDAPHFYAGVVVWKGKVALAAPILKYMLGWPLARVENYVARKAWKMIAIEA